MINYAEDWVFTLLLQRKGSVAFGACFFAFPCAAIAFFVCLLDELGWSVSGHRLSRDEIGVTELNKAQFWAASTFVLGATLIFRTQRAMSRFWEGTGLLHQMRGEWFDSISCCVTFSCAARSTKEKEVRIFRHTLVRLMSLCHASALEEIAGDSGEELETIDPLGLDTQTLEHLNSCKFAYHFNRVEVLLHMTQTLITQALDDGTLKIPPPILSRVYQTLSRGFVNLLNAKKIADTRFPFPYAQLIAILLACHMFVSPLLLASLVRSKFWAAIFSFVSMFSFASINLIGIELENPFGNDANDLPLHHFQGEMNKCLLMLLHSSADIVPTVDADRCIFDFSQLLGFFECGSLGTQRVSRFKLANESAPEGVSNASSSKLLTSKTSLEVAWSQLGSQSSSTSRNIEGLSSTFASDDANTSRGPTADLGRTQSQLTNGSTGLSTKQYLVDSVLKANDHSPAHTTEDRTCSSLRTKVTESVDRIHDVVREPDGNCEGAASLSQSMFDCGLKSIELNTRELLREVRSLNDNVRKERGVL